MACPAPGPRLSKEIHDTQHGSTRREGGGHHHRRRRSRHRSAGQRGEQRLRRTGRPRNPAPAVKASADKSPAKAGKSTRGQLSQHNQQLLADAQAAKQNQVTVLIATDKGQTATVAAQVKALGGSVAARWTPSATSRPSCPPPGRAKAAKLPGVAALDLNETIPLSEPEPAAAATQGARARRRPYAGPRSGHPGRQPLHAHRRDRARSSSRRHHPTWDGRGATIGILDSGVDLDHPALQTTTTGERKIVDWVTATDPLTDGDGTWRRDGHRRSTGPDVHLPGAAPGPLPAGTLQDQPVLREPSPRPDH